MKLSDPINYIQGNFNFALKDNLPSHIQEQIELRKTLCNECLSNSKCLVCKCKTPEMFYSPLKEDSKGRWGKFMDLTQWTALKSNIDSYKQFFDARVV